MKLLQFELKKIIFSKRFLYLMAFIILCISALFLRNHIFQVTIEKEREQHILSTIQEGQRHISELQLSLEANPQDEIAKTKILKMDQIVNTLYGVQKALDAGEWQQELQLENHFLTQLQEYKKYSSKSKR